MSYTIDLMAMTQGTGSFQREFVRYDEVPQHMLDGVLKQLQEDKENK